MAQQLRLRVSETIAQNIDDNGIYASLPTEGDGACGLHALFGSVTTAGVVFAANAREVAKMRCSGIGMETQQVCRTAKH